MPVLNQQVKLFVALNAYGYITDNSSDQDFSHSHQYAFAKTAIFLDGLLQ
jgi:hypothetical protein